MFMAKETAEAIQACAECHHPRFEHAPHRRCCHVYRNGWFKNDYCLCDSFKQWPTPTEGSHEE